MAAYVIILREEPVKDPEALAEYHRLISLGAPPENMTLHTLYGAQVGGTLRARRLSQQQ